MNAGPPITSECCFAVVASAKQCQASIPLYASSRDQDSIRETSGIDGDGDKHKEPPDAVFDILKAMTSKHLRDISDMSKSSRVWSHVGNERKVHRNTSSNKCSTVFFCLQTSEKTETISAKHKLTKEPQSPLGKPNCALVRSAARRWKDSVWFGTSLYQRQAKNTTTNVTSSYPDLGAKCSSKRFSMYLISPTTS